MSGGALAHREGRRECWGAGGGGGGHRRAFCPPLTLSFTLSAARCDPWWQLLSTRSQLVPCPMSRTQPLPNIAPPPTPSHLPYLPTGPAPMHSLQRTHTHTHRNTLSIHLESFTPSCASQVWFLKPGGGEGVMM